MTAARIRSAWVTLTGTGTAVSAVLALLVIATVFVAVAAPRASVGFRTRALHQLIAAIPATGSAISAAADYNSVDNALGYVPGGPASQLRPWRLGALGDELRANLRRFGLPLAPRRQQWAGLTASFAEVSSGAARSAYAGNDAPFVEVMFRTGLRKSGQVIRGRLPTDDTLTRRSARFDVAVTPATAARLGVRPGSVITLGGSIRLTVTGIIRPAAPGADFWTADPNAAAPSLQPYPDSGAEHWLAGAFIGGSEMRDLQFAFDVNRMQMIWQVPLDLRRVDANQAVDLYGQLTRSLAAAGVLTQSVGSPLPLTLSAGLIGVLASYLQAAGQIASLLSLLYISLALVGTVVLLLACRLLAERRAAEFWLMRARGAALRQLGMLALRAGTVVVIPAAAVGGAAAVALTPGGGEPLAWWLGALTALAALAGVPVLAVRRTPRRDLASAREDGPPDRLSRIRWLMTDACLALASVAGLIVLRRQGAPPPGQANLLTSAAPVLVAIPVAIALVRGYPVALRWLTRLAGRRGGGVAVFVGLARAARSSLTTALPVFALVVALAVVAFGATLRGAVTRGQFAASWQAVGADAVVDAGQANVPAGPAAERAIAAVPGVTGTASAGVLAAQTPDGTVLTLIEVAPASYAALIAQTPQPAFPAASLARPARTAGPAAAAPVLISPQADGAVGQHTTLLIGIRTLPVRVTGQIASTPAAIGSSDPFVVLPLWAAGPHPPPPALILVAGAHLDAARLRAVVRAKLPGASVTIRSELLSAQAGAPLPHGAFGMFAQSAWAAAGFAAAILLILLVLGARQRELTLARLVTMGLSAGQARRLLMAEVLPTALAAAAGGTACAAVLVPLIGPAIDLSVLTGTSQPVAVRADLPVLGYAAAGLIGLALATLFWQAALTRVRGAARALRVGE